MFFHTKSESGRSMIEMLGILALVAILSVVAVAGFQVMVNKNKANTVISEAKLAFIEAHAKQNVALNTWERVSFTPSYQLVMETSRDLRNGDYVRVHEVAKAVCQQMLPMQVKGQLAFYTDTYQRFTVCNEANVMIVAWNGLGVPVECNTAADCGSGFQGICTSSGRCRTCVQDVEVYNPDTETCDCNPDRNVAKTCTGTDGAVWCCSVADFCGSTEGDCVSQCDSTQGQRVCGTTDNPVCCGSSEICDNNGGCTTRACSAKYLQQTAAGPQDPINCQMSYDAPGSGYNGLCSLELDANGEVVTVGTGCPAGSGYCYAAYKDADRTQDIPSDFAATTGPTVLVYGTCSLLSEHNMSAGYSVGLDGCGTGKYCYVAYSNSTRTTDIPSDHEGPMYGTCSSLSEHDMSAGYRFDEDSPTCPSGYYCAFQYPTDQNCSGSIQSDATGPIYGVCTELPDTASSMCPYP